VIGRQIAFVDISPEAMRETLLGVGFPVWQADLLEDYAIIGAMRRAAVLSGVHDAIVKSAKF